MARYQVIIAYDGTQFEGYQRQARARTVQGEIESALRHLEWQGRTILSAGRTDTGVHAEGQVIAFDLDWRHSLAELLRALNANLPQDIAAREARQAPADFHPRYAAVGRRYRYRLFCQELRAPLRERYAWRVWPAVDGDGLQAAARLLPGTHDFSAFGTPPRPGSSPVRSVARAGWQRQQEDWVFEIEANAFLYHMVRRLVFVQVQVGQGRVSLEEMRGSLDEGRDQIPGLAPPNGLALVEVIYPPASLAGDLDKDVHTLAVSGEDDRGQDLRP